MSLFVWSSDYSVNHAHIDNQHKELFRLADDLHGAMMRGAAKTVINDTLRKLVDYTRSHFREEEGMMLKSGYPQYASHKAEHDSLTAQVLDLQRDQDAGRVAVTGDTMRFLRAWLERHIMITDRKLSSFFAHKKDLSASSVLSAVGPTSSPLRKH